MAQGNVEEADGITLSELHWVHVCSKVLIRIDGLPMR